MGEHGGALARRKLRDLANDNAASPYWINDDDRVRSWVRAHALSDIAQLSTAHKLRAINTLMGGTSMMRTLQP